MRVGETPQTRKMVKMSHHTTLGSFFLNHPPLRKFRVLPQPNTIGTAMAVPITKAYR